MIPMGAIAANLLRGAGGGGTPYRYVGVRVLTTNTGWLSCGQLSLFEAGSSTDRALAGTAGADYTVHGSFGIERINDNNSTTWSVSSSSGAAGASGVAFIDFGSGTSYVIRKVGWRARNDSFGIDEAPRTWELVAKQNSGDAWTVISSLPPQPNWNATGEYREFDIPSISYTSQNVSTLGSNSVSPAFSAAPSPTFALEAGSLPSGMSLNTSTGEITGTASTPGTYSGIEISVTADGLSETCAPFTLTALAAYKQYFLEVVTTGNTFIGCSTLKLLDGSSVDHALQSNGAVATAVVYTVNGSFPVTNVNDGNDTSFTTSVSSSAGSGRGIMIEMAGIVDIDKVGFRSRSDAFGSGEAITSGFVKARVSSADSWTTVYTVSEAGWANNEYREWTL